MECNPDEEEMYDVNLDDERERHWRVVSEYNGVVVYDNNAFLHYKMWDI